MANMGKKEIPVKLRDDDKEIPDELLCPICKDIAKEAASVPCCTNNFCNACIRKSLLDKKMCPICSEPGISVDNLVANKFLQSAIVNYLSENSYILSCPQAQSPVIKDFVSEQANPDGLGKGELADLLAGELALVPPASRLPSQQEDLGQREVRGTDAAQSHTISDCPVQSRDGRMMDFRFPPPPIYSGALPHPWHPKMMQPSWDARGMPPPRGVAGGHMMFRDTPGLPTSEFRGPPPAAIQSLLPREVMMHNPPPGFPLPAVATPAMPWGGNPRYGIPLTEEEFSREQRRLQDAEALKSRSRYPEAMRIYRVDSRRDPKRDVRSGMRAYSDKRGNQRMGMYPQMDPRKELQKLSARVDSRRDPTRDTRNDSHCGNTQMGLDPRKELQKMMDMEPWFAVDPPVGINPLKDPRIGMNCMDPQTKREHARLCHEWIDKCLGITASSGAGSRIGRSSPSPRNHSRSSNPANRRSPSRKRKFDYTDHTNDSTLNVHRSPAGKRHKLSRDTIRNGGD